MKPIVREHIQQLDVSLGGGIVSDKIRVDTIDNPILIIGLGGTGIDALLRLKYQINRRFKLPEDPLSKKKRDKPDNVEFLAFETNEQDRSKRYKGIGLDPINEFVLLSNPEIGGLLQNRSILEPYITDWLSPELSITDGMNGAAGVRQAGRLLLFTKINQVVQAIDKKIKTLSVGTNKKLMVFLLTGLSGGTGSGCFLDIAYIVRGIIERDHGSAGIDRVNTLGYLFTPDINLSNKSLSEHTREYIKKNGYAALKELDYWMNVDNRGERFNQQYGNILTVNSPLPPFNLCHLISATNTEGKLLENAYDYCMNVTAENITNFMASEEKQSGEEFAIHDYISNIRTNIAQMNKAYPANYEYNIIGASSAVLPIEEMTTYLAYRLFDKMDKMFQQSPTQEEVEKFARKMGVDLDSIVKAFESRVPDPLPGYENSERLSYANVVKSQVVNMDTELEQTFLARAREEYIKAKKQLPGEFLEKFSDQIRRLFLHPEQGPFYVSRLLYTEKGFCLLKMLLSYIEALRENLVRIPRDIEAAQDQADDKLGDAKSAFVSKEKKKNAYIEAKINEYWLHADAQRTEQMIEFYEDLYDLLNRENNRIYSVFTEILNALSSIFSKNGDILTSGDEQVDHKGNKTYYWNIVSVPDISKVVSGIMDQKDVDDLIRDFATELLDHSDQWVKEQEIDIVSSISTFLSDKFGDLITKSMEDFLVIKYGQDEPIEKFVERQIASKLDEEAVPVFHLSNSTGNLHFPSWGFVSVPVQAPSILKGIRNYQNNAVGKSHFTVKESEVKNRIFWLNTRNGVPLFVYTPLKVYEESYERTILDKEGIGRHLVQTEKNNWTYLPSPIPERSWGETYSNSRVQSYNARVREEFAKSLQLKVIMEKDADQNTSSRYSVRLTKPFSLQDKLAAYDMRLDAPKPNLGEVKRCAVELKQLLAEGLPQEGVKDIFGSINEEMAKENLIRSPKLIIRMRQEIAKYEEIAAMAAKLDAVLAQHQDEEKWLDQFIEAMYTMTITKKGALYVYDRDPEEEAWEPFANLMKSQNYVEYEVFTHFRGLDEKNHSVLMRKVSRRATELTASEDIEPLLQTMAELADRFREGRDSLEYEKVELANGEDMYQFYKQIATKLNDIRRRLK
ncbi:tubulin-like doman-containing protein [Paenibacillus motobuensis]|uniref:tubulin-like doman-containing protein n=1 Tax=Paenibacillus TaxID=44249 RepID=UPI00203FBA98|nr:MULTISPECIES: tubulin-like doman-containing protein [Paenibacillus]MCM3042942.1 tubulin-like doman-containing protein [Paenibacillus lutimineralis]MCM3650046.1 tubulin-like doman-containing protein [Paenibacillus motobuensis]